LELRRRLPETPNAFLREFNRTGLDRTFIAHGLQHAVSDLCSRLALRRLKLLAGTLLARQDLVAAHSPAQYLPTDAARIRACGEPGAGRWLTAIAADANTILHDEDFRLAARLRLGLPPSDVMSSHCHSCQKVPQVGMPPQLDVDPWHWLACSTGGGAWAMNMRHNRVRDLITIYADMARALAMREPRGLAADSGLRPDIMIMMGDKRFLLDVTIIHPTCPTHVKQSNAMKTAEDDKTRTYKELAEGHLMEFVPFVVESFGGVAPRARVFLGQLSVFAQRWFGPWSQSEIMEGLEDAIAVAVQSYNGAIVRAAWQKTEAVSRERR
jgi:hypothetical protein